MNECIFEFGPGNRLLGILTGPMSPDSTPGDVAVVFTNTGIIHRVGANRLHVRLARHLARHGRTSLRYDLPGLGDSDPVGTGTPGDQMLAGTRAAFDRLQAMGIANRFVMVGLCSGADHSFAIAAADPRVVAAMLIDPTVVFSTRLHQVIRVVRRFGRGLRPSVAWRILSGRKKLDLVGQVTVAEASNRGIPHAPAPEIFVEARKQAVATLKDLVSRRTQLFFILTGHSREAISYRRQIADAFPEIAELSRILRVEIRPGADHTFSRESDRLFLEKRLAEWLERVAQGVDAPSRDVFVSR